MKKIRFAAAIVGVALFLLIAPFSSHAAEMGDTPEPVTVEEPVVVGDRSERIAYLTIMRYYLGFCDRDLSEYAKYLVEEEGWDSATLADYLAEAYPDEESGLLQPEEPEKTAEANATAKSETERAKAEEPEAEKVVKGTETEEAETKETTEPEVTTIDADSEMALIGNSSTRVVRDMIGAEEQTTTARIIKTDVIK